MLSDPYTEEFTEEELLDPKARRNRSLRKFVERRIVLMKEIEDMNITMMSNVAELQYLETLIVDLIDEKARDTSGGLVPDPEIPF